MDQVAAQCFLFLIAGFDTSSTGMTFVVYELARHEDIQEKLRTEILEILKKYDGEITYEGIMEIPYLDKVIDGNFKHI